MQEARPLGALAERRVAVASCLHHEGSFEESLHRAALRGLAAELDRLGSGFRILFRGVPS